MQLMEWVSMKLRANELGGPVTETLVAAIAPSFASRPRAITDRGAKQRSTVNHLPVVADPVGDPSYFGSCRELY